jgi:hypothetical protein
MADSAAKAIQQKCSGVRSEQGSVKGVGSAPPASFGHTSAKSAGTSGRLIPGTKK